MRQVVGTSDVLGNWTPKKGLQMEWSENDVWQAVIPVSNGQYEFKVGPRQATADACGCGGQKGCRCCYCAGAGAAAGSAHSRDVAQAPRQRSRAQHLV